MLYLYEHGVHRYVVLALASEGGKTEIHFLSRVGGGKGKLPKDKKVPDSELIHMASTVEFHRILEDLYNGSDTA
jgi:hypothetical protein